MGEGRRFFFVVDWIHTCHMHITYYGSRLMRGHSPFGTGSLVGASPQGLLACPYPRIEVSAREPTVQGLRPGV